MARNRPRPSNLQSIESQVSEKYERDGRPHSPQSSGNSGSFLDQEPVFESENSDSDTEIASVAPQRELVSVVWQDLRMDSPSAGDSVAIKHLDMIILGPYTFYARFFDCTFLYDAVARLVHLNSIVVPLVLKMISWQSVNGPTRVREQKHKTRWLQRKGDKPLILKGVSGYAEPRALLAVVGPAKSGKTSLVSLIGGDFWRRVSVTGSLIINGQAVQNTWVKPTFICATDQPMAGITVEQALIYTAMLEMPDHGANLETEVRDVCQRLGLLGSLSKNTSELDVGTRRRLAVASHLLRCTSLLVLHDILEGLQEGDALAIIRAISDMTKEGCTAVLSCSQPSTDICTFFSQAYVLVDGELVYFGNGGQQALEILSGAGMPCPPIYSPVEQFYRLVDPSFEVYLAVQSERGADDWNSQFSGLMKQVLQGAYQGSTIQAAAEQKSVVLATSAYEPFKIKRGVSWYRQCYASVQLLVLQGLEGPALYLGRIMTSVIVGLIYGGSYWGLNTSFRGAQERTTILFLASVILPSLAVGTLPLYHSSHQVFVKDRRRGRSGVATWLVSFFILTLLHLAAAAIFAAVIFIPMTRLNEKGSAWGYFIVNTTFAHMCADAIVLVFATMPMTVGWLGTVGVLFAQMMACGFFPGAHRGFNLPWQFVGFMPWSYKGLLQNEFLYRQPNTWSCPTGEGLEAFGDCQLDNTAMYKTLSQGQIALTDSRWNSLYVLLGIYAAWTMLYLAILAWKIRPNHITLDDTFVPRNKSAVSVHSNGLNTDASSAEYYPSMNTVNIELQDKPNQRELPVRGS